MLEQAIKVGQRPSQLSARAIEKYGIAADRPNPWDV
jgi:hypothetical protein